MGGSTSRAAEVLLIAVPLRAMSRRLGDLKITDQNQLEMEGDVWICMDMYGCW